MIYKDILIIGSGIAGLSFALKIAKERPDLSICILTKKSKTESNTRYAQGGIAVVLDKITDSYQQHIDDTLKSGGGLCNKKIVRMVVKKAAARLKELINWGVEFDKQTSGEFSTGLEGGHSHARILHHKDITGFEIEKKLILQISQYPNITLLDNHFALDIITTESIQNNIHINTCYGAYVLNQQDNSIKIFTSRITLLATGGSGQVYQTTTNPSVATGDGVAMAYRAGAKVANLEFIQFHPTCFFNREAKNFLISEAVRGEGGILINQQGQPFMKRYDERGDLATRDAVARGIDAEMKASGSDCVYLDITHKPADFLMGRFPNIYKICKQYGVDLTTRPIPVVPAAHYMCGGVLVDEWGQTSINNLMAFGETACTGLHGANRLASNSLLEAVVFAHRGAFWLKDHIGAIRTQGKIDIDPWRTGGAAILDESILIKHNWDQVRQLMWDYVGIVRRTKRLELMQTRLGWMLKEIKEHFYDYLLTPDLVELRNLAVVADLIVQSASRRKESRGLHYILDYPEKNDREFGGDTILQR